MIAKSVNVWKFNWIILQIPKKTLQYGYLFPRSVPIQPKTIQICQHVGYFLKMQRKQEQVAKAPPAWNYNRNKSLSSPSSLTVPFSSDQLLWSVAVPWLYGPWLYEQKLRKLLIRAWRGKSRSQTAVKHPPESTRAIFSVHKEFSYSASEQPMNSYPHWGLLKALSSHFRAFGGSF